MCIQQLGSPLLGGSELCEKQSHLPNRSPLKSDQQINSIGFPWPSKNPTVWPSANRSVSKVKPTATSDHLLIDLWQTNRNHPRRKKVMLFFLKNKAAPNKFSRKWHHSTIDRRLYTTSLSYRIFQKNTKFSWFSFPFQAIPLTSIRRWTSFNLQSWPRQPAVPGRFVLVKGGGTLCSPA